MQRNITHCHAMHCIAMQCTVLCCTVLYCTVLYCTVLYCNDRIYGVPLKAGDSHVNMTQCNAMQCNATNGCICGVVPLKAGESHVNDMSAPGSRWRSSGRVARVQCGSHRRLPLQQLRVTAIPFPASRRARPTPCCASTPSPRPSRPSAARSSASTSGRAACRPPRLAVPS